MSVTWSVAASNWFCAWDGWQARLHRLTKNGPITALRAALAARLRRQPVELAVDTLRGRGERLATPGRKYSK
jgi:hypothetical protein